MKLFTIGFTKKNAKQFFDRLRSSGVQQLVDVRLNNTSQLAAFTKRDDLDYFVHEILHGSYHHFASLAPTQPILDAYKKDGGQWSAYESHFNALMLQRQAIEKLERGFFETPSCLLCSEATPSQCHRRLVAEAMKKRWPDIEIVHL